MSADERGLGKQKSASIRCIRLIRGLLLGKLSNSGQIAVDEARQNPDDWQFIFAS